MATEHETVFISDIHLSTKANNTNDLKLFFAEYNYKKLYILGDFIDLWKLKVSSSWPDDHTLILSDVFEKAKTLEELRYVVGNHDKWFEEFAGAYGNVSVMREDTMEINGKKFLIIHGDQYDWSIKWFSAIGILGTGITDIFAKRSPSMSEEPFSLSEYLDKQAEKLVKYDKALIKGVKKKGYDGIIFGHTHRPNLTTKEGLIYINTGDWVKHSTFITKDNNKFQLMQYINGKAEVIKTMTV